MKNLIDKFAARGVEALDDRELLTLVVGDAATADSLFVQCGSLSAIATEDMARLRMIGGLGLKRAREIVLAAELGRRIAGERAAEKETITSSDDVVRLFRPQLERLTHEECWAVYLTSSNRIIESQRISQGGVQSTVVDHRLIIKRALELLATQLILVHNHPSGAALASEQDRQLTERISKAAALFDIRLLDHVIIAREGDYSFRSVGLL